MLKNLSKNAKITLSILLIFIGIAIFSATYFQSIKSNLFNKKNIELIESQIVLPEPIEDIDESYEEIETTLPVVDEKDEAERNNYIGYLEIPSLKIKRGFLSLDSKYNSVNYNVMLIKGSDMPDVINGNLILAAHRGNSPVSFFDKLYTLEMGAKAIITYKGKTYKYELVNSYLEDKDGELTIRRDGNSNVLTLITCTRNDKSTQTVFIFNLVN